MKMKNQQLSQAEQIPSDIWQKIFGPINLRELNSVATVSTFWNKQICEDPRWSELYYREFNELYRLFDNKIPPYMFRIKYLGTKRMIGKIEESITMLKVKEQKTNKLQAAVNKSTDQQAQQAKNRVKIFKIAVKKNSLETVHLLLRGHHLHISSTIKFSASEGLCFASPLVHYAALKGSVDMVKLLLLHGADVTKSITWSHTNTSTKSTILDDISFRDTSKKSLVCICYAEHFLFKNELDLAIQAFKKSYKYDSKIISEYIEQVNQNKMGFKFNYDEDILTKLTAFFKCILDKPSDKHCLIL